MAPVIKKRLLLVPMPLESPIHCCPYLIFATKYALKNSNIVYVHLPNNGKNRVNAKFKAVYKVNIEKN